MNDVKKKEEKRFVIENVVLIVLTVAIGGVESYKFKFATLKSSYENNICVQLFVQKLWNGFDTFVTLFTICYLKVYT